MLYHAISPNLHNNPRRDTILPTSLRTQGLGSRTVPETQQVRGLALLGTKVQVGSPLAFSILSQYLCQVWQRKRTSPALGSSDSLWQPGSSSSSVLPMAPRGRHPTGLDLRSHFPISASLWASLSVNNMGPVHVKKKRNLRHINLQRTEMAVESDSHSIRRQWRPWF